MFESTSTDAVGGNYIVQQFDVNDAISNYLAVVGLIYALIFSQQYVSAISRQREIEDSLATEAGGIQICTNLVRILDDRSHYNAAKVKVLLLLSSYVEDLASHIAVIAWHVPAPLFANLVPCFFHPRRVSVSLVAAAMVGFYCASYTSLEVVAGGVSGEIGVFRC